MAGVATILEFVMTCCVMIGAALTASVVSMVGLVLTLSVLGLLGMVLLRKSVVGRVLAFGLFTLVVGVAEIWWWAAAEPGAATRLAVQQLNGGDLEASRLRTFDAGKDSVQVIVGMAVLLAALACFGNYLKSFVEKLIQRSSRTVPVISGCWSCPCSPVA